MGRFDFSTLDKLFSLPPAELIQQLGEDFYIQIPPSIETIEDMELAGKILGEAASNYSYLTNMAMYAKIRKRSLKRDGAEKKDIEDALSREEIFNSYADMSKMTYNAVSRMITVKQQINDEMRLV